MEEQVISDRSALWIRFGCSFGSSFCSSIVVVEEAVQFDEEDTELGLDGDPGELFKGAGQGVEAIDFQELVDWIIFH